MTKMQNAGNAAQRESRAGGTREQVTSHLNAPRDIEAEHGVIAVVACLVLATLSVGLVIGAGIARALGAQP